MGFVDYPLTEKDLDMILQFADEEGTGKLQAFEFANEIMFSKELAPAFDISRWITASKELMSRAYILERVFEHLDLIKDFMQQDKGTNEKQSSILSGAEFSGVMRDAKMSLSAYDIDLLTLFSIKGSKRAGVAPSIANANLEEDLINFDYFKKAMLPVIKHMKDEDSEKRNKKQQADYQADYLKRMRDDLKKQEIENEKQFAGLDPQRKNN